MSTYRNPIQRNGDFADPFVLRHDGRYYLYGTNPDLRCWSSDDLVHWTAEGPTIGEDEFPGLVPFAPEVVYADGTFYLYTSPSGHGHYVLRSDSPTGPFRAVTGNIGHSIDGHVFIDDDGRWYFYWAGDEGIWGCEMPSPTEFGTPVLTGAQMNGWTEGPFVVKRDGIYHMTLTGNHYLSAGYRINAAYSRHPLTGYRDDPLNPILISTGGDRVGLGHSSTVRGPDLVSTYLVYHNINPDASRDLDIDRQVWNGAGLQVLGPSAVAPRPAAPDASSRGEGVEDWSVLAGTLRADSGAGRLSGDAAQAQWRASAGTVFTAELNLTASADADDYGITLGPPGEPDPFAVRVRRRTHDLQLTMGGTARATVELPPTFVHEALHCWRVVSDGRTVRLFLDGRDQGSIESFLPEDTLVGAVVTGGELRIGHCALTGAVAEEADLDAVRPVPGRFWAALAPDATLADQDPDLPYRTLVLASDAVRYRLLVPEAGRHAVRLAGEFAAGDEVVFGLEGGAEAVRRIASATDAVAATLDLPAGECTLRLRAREGRPIVTLVTVAPLADDPAADDPAAAQADARVSGWGKRILDSRDLDEFTCSATITVRFDEPGSHGDLILRASQLAEGGEGDDTRLGIDFLLGYSVQLHRDRIVLARHAYDERILASRAISLDDSVPHALVAHAAGGRLAVTLDGIEIIHAHDPLPHLTGGVGLRAAGADVQAEDLRVEARRAEEADRPPHR